MLNNLESSGGTFVSEKTQLADPLEKNLDRNSARREYRTVPLMTEYNGSACEFAHHQAFDEAETAYLFCPGFGHTSEGFYRRFINGGLEVNGITMGYTEEMDNEHIARSIVNIISDESLYKSYILHADSFGGSVAHRVLEILHAERPELVDKVKGAIFQAPVLSRNQMTRSAGLALKMGKNQRLLNLAKRRGAFNKPGTKDPMSERQIAGYLENIPSDITHTNIRTPIKLILFDHDTTVNNKEVIDTLSSESGKTPESFVTIVESGAKNRGHSPKSWGEVIDLEVAMSHVFVAKKDTDKTDKTDG